MRWLLVAAALIGMVAMTGRAVAADDPTEDDEQTAPRLEGPRLDPVPTPPEPAIRESIDRGVAFLVADQNPDGSWGSPERTKALNIYAPVPGAHDAFRTAVTSLCLAALIELDSDRPEVRRAIEKGEAWLMSNLPRLRRADSVALYNVWGHGYAVLALVNMYHRLPDDAARRERIVKLIESQYDFLQRYESVDGGWGYYDFRAGAKQPATDSTSFVTAMVLVTMNDARRIGVEPPEKIVRRGVDSIRRQQKPDFSYLYGEYLKNSPMMTINRPGGSLGRSQACNLALRLWGDEKITDDVLKVWLDRLFARNGWLDIGRKRPIPHEAWFSVAGYFYYFGHYYAALAIDELKPEDRHDYQSHLATIMMKHQEADGSWWDFPLYNYHQQYGTAYGIMTLRRCLPR